MGSLGLVPDSYLLPSAIKACAVLKELKPGKQVLEYVLDLYYLLLSMHMFGFNFGGSTVILAAVELILVKGEFILLVELILSICLV